ncbi:hypothetical protein GCM10007285_05000 [Stappia taiwanensis]|nr:hypothetical protein GCM10007285_05000 [Stappia taiwanensis]
MAIIGTPGLSTQDDRLLCQEGFNPHTAAHLFGALLFDTERYFRGDMIGLAMDGGPDAVLTRPGMGDPIYAGAVVRQGKTKLFPVPSPGPFWSAMRTVTGMEEGSLMALGSAATVELVAPPSPPPLVMTMRDFKAAFDWVRQLHEEVSALTADDRETRHTGFDPRFSEAENRISILAKIVQARSIQQVCDTLKKIIHTEGLDPAATTLAISGGFALNCRANSQVMQHFGFARFQAPPAVNDSGISLGYGLLYFLRKMQRFHFRGGPAGMGALATALPQNDPPDLDRILDDLMAGPVVWIEGGAEMGPRALGHRSLLGDPRNPAVKDRLNQIKRRQWWRPVAPVILEEHVDAWFERADHSPYMLRTFTLRPERAAQVPAISHLDRSARIQTLARDEAPRLYGVLTAFHQRTGVPMVCNTSLNDRGEPIINTQDEALAFARRRGVRIVYVDGRRHEVPADGMEDASPLPERRHAALFRHDASQDDRLECEENPHGLDRTALAMHRFLPAFQALDIRDKADAERLRRHSRRLARTEFLPWELIL